MPEPIAPIAPTPSKKDGFMANLLKNTNRVLTPDGKIDVAQPVVVEPPATSTAVPPTTEGRSLGELAVEANKKAASAAAAPVAPVVAPTAPPVEPAAPAPVVPAAPTSRLRKKVEPQQVIVAPVVAAPMPPQPAPVVAPAAVPSADEEYIKSLTPDAKEEIQMAQFGEVKFPELKGKKDELVGFYKKLDKFVAEHPDFSPDSDEFSAFVASNKPKMSPAQRRRVETAYITDQAKTEARKEVMAELAPQLEQNKKRTRTLEVMPLIQKAVGEFETLVTSAESLPDPAMEALSPDVAKLYRDKGYQAVVDEYPVEGPLVAQALSAGQEWLNLTHGLTSLDEANNPTHKWLMAFVANQGNIWKSNPASTVNGRPFMPLMDYLKLSASNPAEAANFHTFTDGDVLNMIAAQTNINYNRQLKSLEKSGFARQKKTPVVNPPQPAPAAPVVAAPANGSTAASPRMRSAAAPEPGTTEPLKGPGHYLIETIIPGAAKRLGI